IGEIVSATASPEEASIPSRHSSGTSASGRSRKRANGNRAWTAGAVATGSHTITSTPSICPASASRHASTDSGAPFDATTTERSTNELDVEQLVDDLALLVVLGLRVHRPDVVARSVEEVERGEDRSPHRVVLVVVAVQPVASERLQVLEACEVPVDDRDRLPVIRVVHRVCLRDSHLDAVDDVLRIGESDSGQ